MKRSRLSLTVNEEKEVYRHHKVQGLEIEPPKFRLVHGGHRRDGRGNRRDEKQVIDLQGGGMVIKKKKGNIMGCDTTTDGMGTPKPGSVNQ